MVRLTVAAHSVYICSADTGQTLTVIYLPKISVPMQASGVVVPGVESRKKEYIYEMSARLWSNPMDLLYLLVIGNSTPHWQNRHSSIYQCADHYHGAHSLPVWWNMISLAQRVCISHRDTELAQYNTCFVDFHSTP